MSEIPHDDSIEGSLALLREGNGFIRNRCRRLGSDVFAVRLLLQDTLCISGEEAARLFYDEERFERAGAAPRLLQRTLFGKGGVQGLDGPAHRQRKQLFLDLLGPERLWQLVALFEERWRAAMPRWTASGTIELLPAVEQVLTDSVCAWAGIALGPGELERRCAQLVALFDGAGGIGPRHWQARRARREAEAWAAALLDQARRGFAPADSPLAWVAGHRELDGTQLPLHTAAVELLNLLRPTVAVARFVVFAALELERHPQWRERLHDDRLCEAFAQEVRRLHAFFPFTAARVRMTFHWQGYRFAKGTRVLLDLYGTNRDPRTWHEAEAFRPERFVDCRPGPYRLVTQGGGDAAQGHRCPGERPAIELLKAALRLLTRGMQYRLPEQDLRIDETRMPSRPASGLLISDIVAHAEG
ncbi:cytochrome P450 [Pseudomonas oligotrophica]|uniref:cytochrome P450 n=1 Tax=Pseudomonas oligotrophica TaxID=2912055 RepID=UPI001F20F7B3|nr:cytochrome P450 [Pseudomonas oligotrophica]MCF7201798.1 cytochrome P450 [Pseudomonas oligotrophica]